MIQHSRLRLFLAVSLLSLAFLAQALPPIPAPRRTPDLPPDDGTPNLWLAAYQGDTDSLERLLTAGAAIGELSPRGTTPLIYALRNRQFAAAKLLLERGANPSQTTREGFSPLSYAFWSGIQHDAPPAFDPRWLRLLLAHGADPLAFSAYREPLLYQVARYYPPQPEALQFVLGYALPVDQRATPNCMTALSNVVFNETAYPEAKNRIVRLLLAAGANPNVSWAANHTVGNKRRYPTPLLTAAAGFSRERELPGNPRSLAGRLELLDLLLAAGADPRFGGNGSQLRLPAECVEIPNGGPGSSSSAGSSWSDLEPGQANPALSEILGHLAPFRSAFDSVIARAAPIATGEIGYPALETTLGQYSRLRTRQEMMAAELARKEPRAVQVQPELQARLADLEYALAVLLQLGARINPEHVLLEDGAWNELWQAKVTPREGGIEDLPLFEHRLPDALYADFLRAGANPAVRKGGHFSDNVALVTHLIRQQAASKLDLLRQYPGLLSRIPPWCGRTVADIGQALIGYSGQDARKRLATPTGQAAKRFLLDLLRQPNCSLPAQVPDLLTPLQDADINQALTQNLLGKNPKLNQHKHSRPTSD